MNKNSKITLRILRRVFVFVMSTMITVAIAAFAFADYSYAEETNYGLLKPNGNNYNMGSSASLNNAITGDDASKYPDKYDGRKLGYSKYISLKDQKGTGLCWACSTMTAVERSWLHEQYKKGQSYSPVTLSPAHLGYFFYNRATDPLGLTTGDRNYIADKYSSDYNWKTLGGSSELAYTALSTWSGMAKDSVAPLTSYNSVKFQSISSSQCYNDTLTIENAEYLYSIAEVKQAIMDHGAVTADYYHNNKYLGSDKRSYFCEKSTAANHAITIVGWDNSYSRFKFDGAGSFWPDGDGAWICQNSWGSNWADGGYFYISYYDVNLSDPIYYDVQKADTYTYNYQYDGTGNPNCKIVSLGTSFVNFYTSKGASKERLDAIGFTNLAVNNKTLGHTVNIYTNANSPADLTEENLVSSFKVETSGGGFSTFELPNEVVMKEGTNFAVCVTYDTADDPADKCLFGIEHASSAYSAIRFDVSLAEGQSYICIGGNWTDLATKKYSARIKAYTNPANTTRIAGSTRYKTSTMIADSLKKAKGGERFDNIVIACGTNYPDALAGGYLADKKNAPLITVNTTVESTVAAYIETNLKSGGTVYILGDVSAVSTAFEKKVKALGVAPSVKRLGGRTRYETNLLILEEAGVTDEDILVCAGNGYADSLSASAVERPILLVGKSMTDAQKRFIAERQSSNIYIIGGSDVVPSDIEKTLKDEENWGRALNVTRLAGATRYQTSTLVAETFFSGDVEKIVLAYGKNFPDGLSGGPLAMEFNAPLILVENSQTAAAAAFATAKNVQDCVILGDSTLISNAAVNKII